MPRICTQGEAVYMAKKRYGVLEDSLDAPPHVCAAIALVPNPLRGEIDGRVYRSGM
mgnify:CR=1 FL=1